MLPKRSITGIDLKNLISDLYFINLAIHSILPDLITLFGLQFHGNEEDVKYLSNSGYPVYKNYPISNLQRTI